MSRLARGQRIRPALAEAVIAVVAMAATAGLTALLTPRPDLVVLGVALALLLSRSSLLATWRGRLESLVVLPLLSLAVAGVGAVFLVLPAVGAALFTAAVALSVAARRLGPLGRRLGTLAALPFVTLLVAPVRVDPGGDPLGTLALVVLVSLVALAVAVLVREAAIRVRLVPRPAPETSRDEPAASTLRPSPPIRMAIQMAVAVGAAWAVGLLLLPGHAAWAPLSAYLVLLRNRGRADVVHASGLRLAGAAAGSGLALLLADRILVSGPVLAGTAIAVLGIGTLLRALASSAFWTLAVTMVVALLQEEAGAGTSQLGPRLLAILIGVALAVVVAGVVLPIRSDGVLRRRIGEVLAALDGLWSGADRAALDDAVARLEEVAPPWRALARLPGATARRRGEWIRLGLEIAERGALAGPPHPRRELGAARRALRDPATLTAALAELRRAL